MTKILLWAAQEKNANFVPRMQAVLHDPAQSTRLRGIAAICLGLVGTKEAQQTLLDQLFDPSVDEFVAWCGIEALAAIGGPEVYASAKRLFSDRAYRGNGWAHHRARAVYLLGWVNQFEGDATLLLNSLSDSSIFVRGYAAGAMARLDLIGAHRHIEMLLLKESYSTCAGVRVPVAARTSATLRATVASSGRDCRWGELVRKSS